MRLRDSPGWLRDAAAVRSVQKARALTKAANGVSCFLCGSIVGPFLGLAQLTRRTLEAILHVPAWQGAECGGVQDRRALMELRVGMFGFLPSKDRSRAAYRLCVRLPPCGRGWPTEVTAVRLHWFSNNGAIRTYRSLYPAKNGCKRCIALSGGFRRAQQLLGTCKRFPTLSGDTRNCSNPLYS
eukprot:6826124-Alexandrium_andersonii.AAC.1